MKDRVLIVDNFDSFTFNLVQVFGSLNCEVSVYRNDAALKKIIQLNPTHLVISPGPGNPIHAGVSAEAMNYFKNRIPVLGVCLGLQVMGSMHGMKVIRADEAVHGQQSEILHDGKGIFRNLNNPTKMARYHSLVLDKTTLPEELEISAYCGDLIMGIRHKWISHFESVQFHPESFMSPEGSKLVNNFLNCT